eukprot:5975526-Prymnesium_polylepis.1
MWLWKWTSLIIWLDEAHPEPSYSRANRSPGRLGDVVPALCVNAYGGSPPPVDQLGLDEVPKSKMRAGG